MSGFRDFAFVEGALDRADALRDDVAALTELRDRAQVIVVDPEGFTQAGTDRALLAQTGAEAGDIFLGLREHEAWFARALPTPLDASGDRMDLRSAASQWPVFEATLFAQARAVVHWRRQYRHCPRCGGSLGFSRGGWQGDCDQCGATHYPRSDPAVIVAVTDGDALLLGRHPSWPAARYSTLAGFVEPGESLELTVAREVMEETGVAVERTRYLASQPWPFPGSLMLGFVAHAPRTAPRVDGVELEDARWFSREEVQAALAQPEGTPGLKVSPRLSISRWLIERWLAGERA